MALKHQVDRYLIEEYVELMAQFEPQRVPSYVQTVEPDYMKNLLVICRKFSLIEASSFLLERQGDVSAAYDLLLHQLQDNIGQLFEFDAQDLDSSAKRWARFHTASQSVLDFCHRQSGFMNEQEREKIWLTLLDELL